MNSISKIWLALFLVALITGCGGSAEPTKEQLISDLKSVHKLLAEGDNMAAVEYFKTPDEMKAGFREFPQAVLNTVRVAESCNLELDFETYHLPNFDTPEGETPEQMLRRLCIDGLEERYGGVNDARIARLDMELGVIGELGFASYFLITWDFIRAAREMGVPVGPGRGSAAGSLVAYCLAITDVWHVLNLCQRIS